MDEFGFSEEEIALVRGMIMATRIPQQPETKLEKILADADLEYLGTSKFDFFSEKLFQELKHFQPLLDIRQWNDIQIKFVSNHFYHTGFCRKYREKAKNKNLEKIKKQAALLL